MSDATATDRSARCQKALQIAREADAFHAIAFLEAGDDPTAVGQDYSEIVRTLYDQKNVAGMIVFGLAGIHFCLAKAQRLSPSESETVAKFKGLAKAISYNLGANTWPGWNDEGIAICATDRAIGMQAALLNLRLAGELAKGPESLGNAHWLIGAQHLAANNIEAARALFEQAENAFQQAGKPDYALMAAGYAALADKFAAAANDAPPSARENADRQLHAALRKLETSIGEDAKFFAEQIRTAEKVLLK